jgi:hypothetical protein
MVDLTAGEHSAGLSDKADWLTTGGNASSLAPDIARNGSLGGELLFARVAAGACS